MEKVAKPRLGSGRRMILVIPLSVAVLALSTGGSEPAQVQLGRQGRLQVRQLEVGYRPGEESLKVRAHLISGLAVEYRRSEGTEIDRILKFAELQASGRARLFVELEGDVVQSFDAAIP